MREGYCAKPVSKSIRFTRVPKLFRGVIQMDNEVKVIMRILNEHDSRLALLASKVKWLEKERIALTKRLDNLKQSDIERMV